MMLQLFPSSAGKFGAVAVGAMVGALQLVVLDSFGATIESMILPWCGWLLAHTLLRLPVARRLGDKTSTWRWVSAGASTAAVLLAAMWTEGLAMGVGSLSLPRAALPLLWTGFAAFSVAGPVVASGAGGASAGPLLALGYLCGLLLPGPVVALLVGVASAAPMVFPRVVAPSTDSSPHDAVSEAVSEAVPGVLDRLVLTAGAFATTALGVHILVVVQPTLDPTPTPMVAAAFGAVCASTLLVRSAKTGVWYGILGVGLAAAGAALVLPHAVGLGRLVHTTHAQLLDPGWSASSSTAVAGLAVGLLFAPLGGWLRAVSPAQPLVPAAAALGLAAGLVEVPPTGQLALAIGVAMTALALLFAATRPVQVAALVLGGILAAVVWRGTTLPLDVLVLSPVSGLRSAEAWTSHLDRAIDLAPGIVRVSGRSVGVVLAAPEDWRAAGTTDSQLAFEADVAGRVSRPSGRRAEAEVMAGMLAGLLAPRLERVQVLNDDVGSVLAGLSPFEPAAVDIATPNPGVVQDVADLTPQRRDRWLQPGVRLWPEHPASVLRRAPNPAAIVDVAHGTWFDGAHSAPTNRHFAAAHQSLGDFGVYVLCVHLDALQTGAPARIARSLAAEFGHLQLWLPPSGADSMVLVASGRPLPLARLEQRAEPQLATLRSLGFPNPASLATMAIGATDSVASWSVGPDRWSPPLWLGAGLRGTIPLHLASFAPHVGRAEQIWDLTDARTGTADLAGRIDARRRFLELLDDAARGNVSGALEKARGLANDDGGDRALRALVGPHLENARKALKRAVAEGPSSSAWADVQRFATTARMIAPTSPEPLIILGTTSLARADLSGAQKHFAEAERLADGNLEALGGLARVAILRKDPLAAEQYFREATTANPRQWIAWHRLGVFLTDAGRHEEAEKSLKKAVGLAEGSSPAPTLALARLYLLTERATAALVHAEGAIVMGAQSEGYFLRGLAYRDLDQLDNAEKDFRQTVLANPAHTAAHGEIGRIRAVKGDRAAAEEAWKSVLRIDPNNVSARENLRRLGIKDRAEASGTPGAPAEVSPEAGKP